MEELKKMATRKGFVEVFWARLQEHNRTGEEISMGKLYDDMAAEYEAEYRHELFPSYNAFSKWLRRHR